MKKTILCILVVITIQFAYGQRYSEALNLIDSTFTISEINTYEDTLWVLDSSHFYNSTNFELQFSGKYNVLSRDESGNKLTGLGKNYIYGVLENSYLDSITYYFETSDINYTQKYSWSFDDYKWMDNSFQFFDNNHNLVEQYNKSWSIYHNEYMNGRRTIYKFDNDLQTFIVNYNYISAINEWEPIEKQAYYYNEQNKDSLRVRLKWNIESEQWINQYKNEVFHNDSLNYFDYYGSNWDEVLHSWINDVHTHYEYAENGQVDSTTVYRWDTIINEWVFERKSITIFNETGQLLEYLSMSFNNQTSIWMNDMKLIYLYNNSNIERIRYTGDSNGGDWLPYHREFRSFAYDNVVDTTQYDFWDTISQQWNFTSRFISVFDWRLNQTSSVNEVWNSANETWQIIHRVEYFWSPFHPLNFVEYNSLNDQIKIYPNPANSVFNIEVLPDDRQLNLVIKIFDINGRLVLESKQISSSKQFNIKHLDKGLYLVKIQDKSSFVTKRILIQ